MYVYYSTFLNVFFIFATFHIFNIFKNYFKKRFYIYAGQCDAVVSSPISGVGERLSNIRLTLKRFGVIVSAIHRVHARTAAFLYI